MRAKIFLVVFALPFFGVGVWMLVAIGESLFDAWQMQSWESAEAQLSSAGFATDSGGDSDTYEAFAQYTYRFRDREYTHDRVGIAGGADNIGDYQMATGQRLRAALDRGEAIEIYVNPDKPQDAVFDRDLRWELIGFKSLFVLMFGGAGLGLIIFGLRKSRPKNRSDPGYADRPWLLNDKWQTATIKSSSKSTMYFTWGFAAFWNLLSAPVPFVMYREIVEKENLVALIAALFPLIGMGLIVWSVRRTLEWKRFGSAPVALDPFPGAIGGNVGGTLDVSLPYDSGAMFRLTLTSIYSYMSGSGKNRSRNERAKWQDSQVANTAAGNNGTRLTFCFDVPDDLAESDAEPQGNDYYLWRLNVKADLPGVDFDRDYEIPVYATGSESRHLSRHSMESVRNDNDRLDDVAVSKIIRRGYGVNGRELFYPAGRNPGAASIGLVFGGIFAGAGWFLFDSEGQHFFGSVFGGVGSLIVLASLYSALNSLQVHMEGEYLRTVRRIIGIPVSRRQLRRAEFVRFARGSSYQAHSGGTHVMHYSIRAEGSGGQKIVVGEGFKGDGEARAAIRLIERELGLQARADETATPGGNEIDVLASDG